MSKILLLEDDPNLSQTLLRYLKFNDFEVDWVKNGEEALDFTYENRYDLYLFDINVPLINGIDLLKELRDAHDLTPTIIISALIDIESVTKGFMAGADDYLKKPFDPEELLIRIKAKTQKLKPILKVGNLELNFQEEMIKKNGERVYLTSIQYNILKLLLQNYPNPAKKESLLELTNNGSEGALRVQINKLKSTFDINIKSIRGVGYTLLTNS